MLLQLTWFRKPRSRRASCRFPRLTRYNPAIERLEERTLLSATTTAAAWGQLNGNAQHTGDSSVVAQPINQVLYSVPLDLEPWGAEHYGSPVFTSGNTVIVPIKVTWSAQEQNAQNFYVEGLNTVTGQVLWTSVPTGTITAASNSGPIVITSPNNGLVTGDSVTIGGVQGDTNANGTFTVTYINQNQFSLDGTTGNGAYAGGGTWVSNTGNASYIDPAYSWLPPFQPVYDAVTNRVYFPGPGGTIDYIADPDTAGQPTIVQEAFFGNSSYLANESAYNSSIYINTGLTVDSSGNVYFGFTETGTNPAGITDGGVVRISPTGAATYTLAYSAVGQTNDGNWNPALGSSLAISNDGSTVYIGVNDSGYSLNGNEYDSYLVALNSTTLAPENSVPLLDPSSGYGAGLIDVSTASPMVAPDGTVYQGVFGNPYNGSRGYLLHFSGDLSTEFTPGAFGWDDTPSIIPASMVPSYTGSSTYLILCKYNDYANADFGGPNTGNYGGNGVNEIAVLDPYASVPDPNNDPNPNIQVMATVEAFASPSPDVPAVNAGDPDAVREWCTNGTAVDPATDSVFINNEDGYTYEWNLATDTITNAVEITTGVGVPYTPTAIAPNGEVFSDNGGTLFAEGGYSNYTLTTTSNADPSVVGNPITFTTTLASTDGGAVPSGTVTFSYTEGANNPFNSTPIQIGNPVPVVDGVASVEVSGWVADHYHVVASYSGDNTYSAGQSTLVQPVLETAATTVSASSNPIGQGDGVTFTATVAPNGSSFVPIGTVTFMDGDAVLGTASLNSLDNEAYPPSDNTATLTVPSLPGGTDVITAVYSGDLNFTGDTSAIFNEYVPAVANPGTQNSAVGDTVSLQVDASGLAPGDTWTYSATGLPSGLSISSSTGLITGTITGSASTYSATVSANDGQGDNPSQTFTWNVSQLAVTNPGTQNSAVGDTISLQVQDSGLPSGDLWSYSASGLPSGLSINARNGLITGTITGSANTYSASVTASDGQGGSATQGFTWNVSQLSVTDPGTKSNAVGDTVSYQVQASGLPTGDSWTFSATGLPSGLSINASSGLITGTVTGSAENYSATVTASDGAGASASQTFAWDITVLTLGNPGTQNNAVGDAVIFDMSFGGLPGGDTWGFSATGLPPGLLESNVEALILGTVAGSANTYTTTVEGGDHHGALVSQTFTWNVSVLSVTNPGTQNNAVGDSVSLQIQDSGLPSGDTWSYSASLPSGLSINKNTGLITGTISGSATTFSASVTASDGQGASQTQSFTWNVSTLSVTNPGTQNNAVGDTVTLQVQDSGLPSGDSWSYSATGLPSGLSINASSGLITGTITGSANTYSASVTASDGQGDSATQSFTWNVSQLSVTNPGTQNNAVSDTVSLQIQDSGLPSGDSWSYSAPGLPSGLSISASTGLITGTITGSANTYSASVTASDGQGASATQDFTWNVSQLAVTNPGTKNNAVGDSVSLQVQDSGLPSGDSWSYTASGLPAGLSINANSGLISGTITGSANTYSAAVTASDGQGASETQDFTWNVSVLSVNNPGTQNSALGASVSLSIQASGLPSGDSWSYSATGLPSGLSINASSGLITGKITGSPETYSPTVTAADGKGASASQTFAWNVGPTTTTLTSSVDPSDYGQKVTFTATVAAVVSGSGKPTGSVEFKDGSTVIDTAALSSADKATYTTSAFTLPVGGDSITAVYVGSSTFETSTSNVVTQTVNLDPTTTTVKSSAAPAVVGQSVTLTATVTSNNPGSGTPTGTVEFFDGNTPLGPGTLNSSGKTTLVTSSLPLGSNSITVTYTSDGNYQTSTSNPLSETINAAATKTVVATSGSPSTFGQLVTFTATVTVKNPGSGAPFGTVEFKDGSTVIDTGTLNGSGQATYSTSTLAVGSHSITAVFEGDADFTTSTSGAITQRVTKGPAGAAVISSQQPVGPNTQVTFTATVTPTTPGAGMPTGTVTFYSGSTVLGTETLDGNGQAKLTFSWKNAGSYKITVMYNGDSNFASIKSDALTQTVT